MNALNRLRKILTTEDIDAALISSVSNIRYLTGYTGFSSLEREAFLLITTKNQYLFTDGRYIHEVTAAVPSFTVKQISASTSLSTHLSTIVLEEKLTSFGIEINDITVAEYERIEKVCKSIFPLPIELLRIIKTPDEISSIKKACEIGDVAFGKILNHIQEGITEKELAFILETFIRETGNDISFPTIVAFGKNAAIPHHKTDDTKLSKNTFILFDFGVLHNAYCSDMTRTIFFGKANSSQKKLYETVLNAQQKAIILLESKIKNLSSEKERPVASDIDKTARDYITSQGYPTIPHSLGHGIGIDVHEAPSLSPRSSQVLTKGMVFSIEPGIYHPGEEGIRIEDLFTIQGDNLIQLTQAPKALLEL